MGNVKGVRLHNQTNKWTAVLWYNGKSNHIGLYETEAEAISNLLKETKRLTNLGVKLGNYKKNYVDAKELYVEIIVSKAMGKLTRRGLDILMKMVKHVNSKFNYNNPDDRQDVIAYSYEVLIKNWYHFDEDVYDNAFAYYTELIKRAHAFQWKGIQKSRVNTISLDHTNSDGRSIGNYL